MADKYGIFGAAYEGDGSVATEATGSTVTITIASPGVVTWNNHPFVNDDKVFLQTSGALPTGLNGTTTYYVRNKATNTFELSTTPGGASINTSGTQSGTHKANGVGAWKMDQTTVGTSTEINILLGNTPNHGSIAAGDVVYIRSKTGNGADANISVSPGANVTYGNASGTATSPITWILDAGEKWSGVNGTLTYTHSAAFSHTMRYGNKFVANTRDNWIIENTQATIGLSGWATISGVVDGIKFSTPNRTGTSAAGLYINNAGPHRLTMSTLRIPAISSGGLIQLNINQIMRLNDLVVEIGSNANIGAVFSCPLGGRCLINGGRIQGAGASSGIYVLYGGGNSSYFNTVEGNNFVFPNTMTPGLSNGTAYVWSLSAIGVDGNVGGVYASPFSTADSRNIGGNYPTLNATLPDSASTPASWRWGTTSAASLESPADFRISKLYTGTAASKTVTVEFLLPTVWAGGAMNKKSLWMEVCYIDDSTGVLARETTYDLAAGAFSPSYVGWSSTSWGAVNFDKKKLSVTTTGSIKQDTAVAVTLFCSAASGSANDVLIVCPDVQLSS